MAEVSIGFLSGRYTVTEGQSAVTVEVGITEGRQETNLTLSVEITLTNGTAQGNDCCDLLR